MQNHAWIAALCLSSAAIVTGCAPASVAEAEAQRNVGWLDAQHDRLATEALGRLADHDAKAAATLAGRRGDAATYHAAWLAHTRAAGWGTRLLRAAMGSPDELSALLPELPPRDPRLEAFAPDLAHAVGVASPPVAAHAASLLASLGVPAEPPIAQLLATDATREATCIGLRSPDASAESRLALTLAPVAARTSSACKTTLFQHATSDERVLGWLGALGEPELLAGAVAVLPCPTVGGLWERAFGAERDVSAAVENEALGAATARCPEALDAILARALPSSARVRPGILRALGLKQANVDHLDATCKQLPRLRHGRAVAEDVRLLASRVYEERCKPST